MVAQRSATTKARRRTMECDSISGEGGLAQTLPLHAFLDGEEESVNGPRREEGNFDQVRRLSQ